MCDPVRVRTGEQRDARLLGQARKLSVLGRSVFLVAPQGVVAACLGVDALAGLLFVIDLGDAIAIINAVAVPLFIISIVRLPFVAVLRLGPATDVCVGRAAPVSASRTAQ